ncbi:MAG: DUF2799 domain-containing protein [Pseudomonadota bacterium]|nr:DUF2799 domain-containing protein [Pseudomonadota bacterium]
MRIVGVGSSAFALAACASFGPDCAGADWRAIGFADGAAGMGAPHARYETHACTPKAGADSLYALYAAGWSEGVVAYCTPANGFALGASGAAYNGVCDSQDAASFGEAFRNGEALYLAEAEAAAARNAYSDAQRALWDIKHRLASIDMALKSPSTGVAERRERLAETKALKAEMAAVEKSLAQLERDRLRAEAEAAVLRSALRNGVVTPTSASF